MNREAQKLLNKTRAWAKGQNPWVTIETNQSNKKFVRVKANSLWGDPRGKTERLSKTEEPA